MLINVKDLNGTVVHDIEVQSSRSLGAAVSQLLSTGQIREGYQLEGPDDTWIIRDRDGVIKIERLTGSKGTGSQAGGNAFASGTHWEGFWYFMAFLTFGAGAVLLLLVMNANSLWLPLIAPCISGGIAALFFGWISRVQNDMRYLQSQQLEELKRHHKYVEEK